jgi:hypothetical protein
MKFLSQRYPSETLLALIPPFGEWQPYPPSLWASLNDSQRSEAIASGAEALAMPWPHLPATLYLRFARDGDRAAFEEVYFLRRNILARLVIAECVERQGRFLDAIADAAWSICEESSWCLPAHINAQSAGTDLPDTAEPIVDLFAAETAASLAWTYSLLADRLTQVSPLIPARIEREIQARLLTPALERNDFWWMGFTPREVNNWNPWINSNWLVAILLIERDPARRQSSLDKLLHSLDRFIVPYPADGGCDEGPSYWTRAGASLYDCLELLYSASGRKMNVYDDPKIQNIGRFIVRAHIADDFYVNFADAPAVVQPDAALVSGFGGRIGDADLVQFGQWLASRERLAAPFSRKDPDRDLTRTLAKLFQTPAVTADQPPLLRQVYLPNIQVMAARERAGSRDGWYLAAKGGHNDESHNHNDVGHFIVYRDGRPLIIDAGVETYTRKTFSPQRYEIWTMQSAYHSLPTINGVMQSPGREFKAQNVAYRCEEDRVEFSLDIAGAYPPEAGLRAWQRRISLHRRGGIEMADTFECAEPPRSLTLSLLTPCQVEIRREGEIALGACALPRDRSTASGRIHYPTGIFQIEIERIPITDARLGPIWGEAVFRLLFSALHPAQTGQWVLKFHPEG